MKKIISLLLASMLFSIISFGQNGLVAGSVKDNTNQPVPYATIQISKSVDSITIKATVTDKNGLFQISKIENGNYLISVSSTGFEKESTSFIIDSIHQKIDLPDFKLISNKNVLEAVTISTSKKFIEVKADKTILNIENNIMASGSSAFDMIKKGPAVSIDKDDNIKMKGGMVQIFIDGKPFYLSGQQLTDYLKSLPADAVSKIEIISNPGSRYEAQGTAGIINLKLKKSQANGLNGTASLGAGMGRYPKANGSVGLNYRKDKWNLFGSAYYGYSESFNQLNVGNVIGSGTDKVFQSRDNYWHPFYNFYNYTTGIDYKISEKSTIGFLMRGSVSDTKSTNDNHTIFQNDQRIPESFINTLKQDTSNNRNATYNLNFKTSFDSLGSELNIDADYVRYVSEGTNINSNYFVGNKSDTLREAYIFRNNSPANVSIVSLKTDYTKYFHPSLKFEAGIKTSFVKTDNNLKVDSIKNGNWNFDYNQSNHFVYEENINAAYLNMNKEWTKLNVQAGLRVEQTNYTTNSITANQVNKKSYLDLFPSLFASYKLNENNTFNVNYTRRINRPSYQSLNPFTTYVDPYTRFQGNPYLQPSYSNSIEVKHSFKQFLFTSLSYQRVNNNSIDIIIQDEQTKMITNTTLNSGYSNYASLNISAYMPVTKWWLTENNVNVYYSNVVSEYTGFAYNTKTVSAEFSNSNTFTLPNNIKMQASVYYSAPSTQGYYHVRGSVSGSFGIQKQVWNKKGTLKFSVANIGANAYVAHIVSEKLDILWRNQWEGPRFNLNYSWRFGSTKVKSARSRKTASSEETNRVNL